MIPSAKDPLHGVTAIERTNKLEDGRVDPSLPASYIILDNELATFPEGNEALRTSKPGALSHACPKGFETLSAAGVAEISIGGYLEVGVGAPSDLEGNLRGLTVIQPGPLTKNRVHLFRRQLDGDTLFL